MAFDDGKTGFSLNRFKSTIQDLARPNLFAVKVGRPNIFNTDNARAFPSMEFGGSSFTGSNIWEAVTAFIRGDWSNDDVLAGIVFPGGWPSEVITWASDYGWYTRDKDIHLVCEAAEFPGKTISTTEDALAGPSFTMPYDTVYNNVTLTFLARKKMYERAFFDLWMEGIIGTGTPQNDSASGINIRFRAGEINYYDDIHAPIEIFQLDEKSNQVARTLLAEAYPIALSSMNLNWDERDTYQRFTVTFAYRYHNVDYDDSASPF